MVASKRLFSVVCANAVAALALAAASIAAWAQQPPPQRAAATQSEPEYRLGAGDVVRVSVYQNPDLTLEARVSEAGVISYPLLGAIRIGGITIGEAERLIANGLRDGNYVKQPQVSVMVMQVRGSQASVLGLVNRPGRFPIETADMRLSDLLASAGGVAAGGADIIILVGKRDGKPLRKEIDLRAMFRERRDDDMLVANGDVVYVDRAPMIYIYGEVQRPGALRLEPGMTVMQALATGGGLTPRGTERGLRVHRKDGSAKTQVLQPSMDDVLQEGDVLYVRESLF